MKFSASMIPLVAAVTLLVLTSSCDGVVVIDLTYQLKEGENLAWPIYPEYQFTVLTRGHSAVADGWLESNKIALAEHTGTHVDAPSHFAKDHWRMQQVPVSRLVGPGVVIDVKEKVNGNPDYGVTVDDLKDWEAENGKIPDGAVVLMNSGWGSRYPDKKRVFNTEDVQNTSTFHFPGFSGDAARWLAEERNVIAVGGDVPSPDVALDKQFPVHKTLLANDILILENVAYVDRLPVKGATIIIGALNIFDGSGSPMRLLGLLSMDCAWGGSSGGWTLQGSVVSVAVMAVGLCWSTLLH